VEKRRKSIKDRRVTSFRIWKEGEKSWVQEMVEKTTKGIAKPGVEGRRNPRNRACARGKV